MAVKTRSRILRRRGLAAGQLPKLVGAVDVQFSTTARSAALAGALPKLTSSIAGTITSTATLASDWLARSTAPGVTQAKRFTSLADVGNRVNPPYWPAPGDVSTNMVIPSNGGIIGDGCARFVIPKTQGARPNSLLFPLNTAWTNNTQGFGATRFYIQFRAKIGPMLLADWATRGTGLKYANVANYNFSNFTSSQSNTEYEIVPYVNHVNASGEQNQVNCYRNNRPLGGGGLANGTGDVETGGSGAGDSWHNDVTLVQAEQPVVISEDDWYTFLLEIQISQYGVRNGSAPGNFFSLKVAGPADTAYTEVFRSQNFGIGTEGDAGLTGFWFTTGYDSFRTSAPFDSYVEVDQLIVSTQPIAVPLPKITVPSWAKNATPMIWADVPGTATGTITASGTPDPVDVIRPWTGFVWDYERRRILGRRMGGHNDRGDTDGIDLDLTQESCAWVQLFGPSAATSESVGFNSEGRKSDGTSVCDHNYNLTAWANGKAWFPAFGAMSDGPGNTSSAIYSWDPALLAATINTSRGYVYLGKADSSTGAGPNFADGVRWVEAGCDYDPIGRKVWALRQNWAGTAALLAIDVDTGAFQTYVPSGGNGNSVQQIIIHPAKRLLLAIGSSATLRMNLDTPGTFTACNESTRPTLPKGFGAALSKASGGHQGAVLCWNFAGTSLQKMIIPESPHSGAVYAWSTVAAGGTIPVLDPYIGASPPDGVARGIWKKFGMIPMGDGHDYLFVVGSPTAAVKFLKLPKEGV